MSEGICVLKFMEFSIWRYKINQILLLSDVTLPILTNFQEALITSLGQEQ